MRPQATDVLTLDAMLGAMAEIGGYYIPARQKGYRDGFEGRWEPPQFNADPNYDEKLVVYRRMHRHGKEAMGRGAHGGAS